MFLEHWLRRAARQSPSPGRRRARLEVELLERRDLLSGMHFAPHHHPHHPVPHHVHHGHHHPQPVPAPMLPPTAPPPEDTSAPPLSHIDYNGGPLLQNVQVRDLFLGADWTSSETLVRQVVALDDFMSYITGSPYMDLLGEYGTNGMTIGRGQFLGSSIIENSPLLETAMDNSLIRAIVQAQIDAQANAGEPPNANSLYCVFTQPGTTVNASDLTPSDFLGYHWLVTNRGVRVAYAVMPYPGDANPIYPGLTPLQSLTLTLSHEVAEAITDPLPGSGWSSPAPLGEIGDPDNAKSQVVYLGGYALQKLWSNTFQNGTAPAGAVDTQPVSVKAQDISATVGQEFSGTIATFRDDYPNVALEDLRVTVNWNDGSPPETIPAAQISGPDANGEFTVQGIHSYQSGSSRTLPLEVTVEDLHNGSEDTDTGHATVPHGPPILQSWSPLNATEGIAVGTGTATGHVPLATFQYPDALARTEGLSYRAEVSWDGGNTFSLADANANSDGTFTVSGGQSDPYPEETSSLPVEVSLTDSSGNTYDFNETVSVADAPLTLVSLNPPSATEGAATRSATLATVQDGNPNETGANLVAVILWGDGTSTKATLTNGLLVANGNGSFSVVAGGHTYQEAAQGLPFTVQFADVGRSSLNPPAVSLDVTEAALSNLVLTPPNPTEGADTGLVALATFHDANPDETGADLAAAIAWGDGSTDTATLADGLLVYNGNGNFTVYGQHTYAEEHLGPSDGVTFGVAVEDVGDPQHGTVLSQSATVFVGDADLSGSVSASNPSVNNGVVTGSFTFTILDANLMATFDDFSVTVTWSDGTKDTVFFIQDDGVTPGGRQFTFSDSHSWDASLSSFSATITVGDAGVQLNGNVSWGAH